MKRRTRPAAKKDGFEKTNSHEILKQQLMAIDKEIQRFIFDIINEVDSNVETLYFKTEFKFMAYNLMLFNKENNVIVGKTWPVIDFVKMGAEKKLEFEINTITRKLLLEVRSHKAVEVANEENIIWI